MLRSAPLIPFHLRIRQTRHPAKGTLRAGGAVTAVVAVAVAAAVRRSRDCDETAAVVVVGAAVDMIPAAHRNRTAGSR